MIGGLLYFSAIFYIFVYLSTTYQCTFFYVQRNHSIQNWRRRPKTQEPEIGYGTVTWLEFGVLSVGHTRQESRPKILSRHLKILRTNLLDMGMLNNSSEITGAAEHEHTIDIQN